MADDVVVRPVAESDLEQALVAVAAHDPELVDEARVAFLAALAQPRPSMCAAELGGAVVGVMGFRDDPWGVPDVYWLEWLFVLPEVRRHGVAAALYGELERRLKALGCRKAYLDVGNAELHTAAIAFHESQGFALEGVLKDFWADGEDFLVFGKRLT